MDRNAIATQVFAMNESVRHLKCIVKEMTEIVKAGNKGELSEIMLTRMDQLTQLEPVYRYQFNGAYQRLLEIGFEIDFGKGLKALQDATL